MPTYSNNNSSPRIQQIKKVFPSEDEIRINKRSRSAILRVGELICENENCKIRNEKQTI